MISGEVLTEIIWQGIVGFAVCLEIGKLLDYVNDIRFTDYEIKLPTSLISEKTEFYEEIYEEDYEE